MLGDGPQPRDARDAGTHAARLAAAFGALVALTTGLIVLGALVRAHDAGLACPDWPLCFGEWVPRMDLRVAFEWTHRVVAGGISLLFAGLAALALRRPDTRRAALRPLLLGAALLALQIALGALTVWKLLASWTVTSHLLTGNAFAVTLLWTALALREAAGAERPAAVPPAAARWVFACAPLLVLQITLGGLVSSRYAGMVCPEWPTCNGGLWLPSLRGEVGLHLLHRFGGYALLVALLAAARVSRRCPPLRGVMGLAAGLGIGQVAVGVANVLLGIPVEVTALHSALAAALALCVSVGVRRAWRGRAGSRRSAPGVAVGALLLLTACGAAPRGDCDPDPPPGRMGSVCGFHNPEDVLVVESAGLLLVSQMDHGEGGGSLAALALGGPGPPRPLWPGADAAAAPDPAVGDPACPGRPDPRRFAPHGIAAAPTGPGGSEAGAVSVGVVAHGAREAIELFALSGRGAAARLTWRGCIPLPADVAANDLVLPGDGRVVASNYQPTLSGWRGAWHSLRGGLGLETGDVMVWRPTGGWHHLPGSGAANPNGVLWDAERGRVWFAQTGTGRVAALELATGRRDEVELGGYPDNLSRGADGRILVAVHRSGLQFMRCSAGGGDCRAAWSLFEIDPATLRARELLRHDGEVVGGVASAARSGRRLYFGAVFGDRIGTVVLPGG